MPRPLSLSAALAALLLFAPDAHAQGGVQAPDFSDPCTAVYPGDGASREPIARWMAAGASARGLPPVLPVMAGIAESGLRNLKGASYRGFFGMSRALNSGPYRGFGSRPELQLLWFLDTARSVRQRRVAEVRPDPADDEGAYGLWIADVERPAPENRSGYQQHLAEARELVGAGCAAAPEVDTVPPALKLRLARRQRPLSSGGIVLRVRCTEKNCLTGASATVRSSGRTRTLRATAVEPGAGWATLTLALPRTLRRTLAKGPTLRAAVTVVAADEAANPAPLQRSVRLLR